MRSSYKIFFPFLIIAFSAINISAQEVVTPLRSNDIVRSEYITRHQNTSNARVAASVHDTISLPILDDFSKTIIYTDTTFWLDNSVYVERDMPIAPITVGVATFDGVSRSGCPYDTLTTNSNLSVSCDTLSSKPIDLSVISIADTTLYLSFFYEAQGRGDMPDPDDSLLLEFHKPINPDSVWSQMWAHKGYTGNHPPDSIFRIVMIRIDSSYFKKGFKFRFRNKATPSGYDDQWHIDYVYLNDNRTKADTLFRDVAFVYSPSSLLKKYQAMPYEQYQTSEMVDSLSNYIRNNDTVYNHTSYYYRIKYGLIPIYTSITSTGNIESIFDYSYTICTIPSTGCRTILRPPLNYAFNAPMLSPIQYTVEHVITPSSELPVYLNNDTIRRKQDFGNYYAYDDGTAEYAYGLNQAGSMLAYRFTLNHSDSIRGVDMYFNWMPNGSTNNVSQLQFRLTVWNDAAGIPGTIIYQDSAVTPAYQYEDTTKRWPYGCLTNVFTRYPFTHPKLLSGTFYVGWVQYTPELLNIGFDYNTNSDANMFFNTSGVWYNSVLPGSWMIRPLFGTRSEMQGVVEHKEETNSSLQLFPNPANDEINIQSSSANYDRMKIMIMDAVGRIAMPEQKLITSSINVSSLSNGIYFVRITDEQGHPLTRKLIIAR